MSHINKAANHICNNLHIVHAFKYLANLKVLYA